MVSAGICFCPNCANIYKDAFYKTGSKRVGAVLKRSILTGRFEVEAFDPQPLDSPDTSKDVVKLASQPPADCDGFPDTIDVKFNNESVSLQMTRHCPKCLTEQYPSYGKYPLFVIASVGDIGAGKSAWLGACAYIDSISAVNSANYPIVLDITPLTRTAQQDQGTNKMSPGNTKFLRIRNRKKDNRIIADVLLLDVAGELYRGQTAPDRARLWRFLAPHDGYTGADAFVFLEPATNLSRNEILQRDLEFGALDIYDECKKKGLLTNKPVAYVCCCLDKLIEEEEKKSAAKDGIKLVTKDTFSNSHSYEPSVLISRVAMEHAVAMTLKPIALRDLSKDWCKGFMVQSCKDTVTKDTNVRVNDYSHHMNVMDPLLWILNRMGLFSLVRKGEK